jgi:hypothetical protein
VKWEGKRGGCDCAGYINTNLNSVDAKEERSDSLLSRIIVKRWSKAGDFKKAAAYLSSNAGDIWLGKF